MATTTNQIRRIDLKSDLFFCVTEGQWGVRFDPSQPLLESASRPTNAIVLLYSLISSHIGGQMRHKSQEMSQAGGAKSSLN